MHHNVECDSCGLSPIRGARYKSLVSMHSLHLQLGHGKSPLNCLIAAGSGVHAQLY